MNQTNAQTARVHVKAISSAFGQILHEARNQLLILAAGSLDKTTMERRMQFRTKVRDVIYREIAFVGADPKDKYLLLNYEGNILTIPPEQADGISHTPFHTPDKVQKDGKVLITPPTEVVYPTMTSAEGVRKQISMQVIRFSTPVFTDDGNFRGVLTLSLDIHTLRWAINSFSKPDEAETTSMRIFYADRDGWMIFQNETGDGEEPPLRIDSARSGFTGEFGRAGFPSAFKPGPEYVDYWRMITDVGHGHAGQRTKWEGRGYDDEERKIDSVSYAPITYQPSNGGPNEVVGSVIVLNSMFTDTTAGNRLNAIYICALLASTALLSMILVFCTRIISRPIKRLEEELVEEAGKIEVGMLPEVQDPLEVANLRRAVNGILERLSFLEKDRDIADTMQVARHQLDRMEPMPVLDEEPESGIFGNSPEITRLREDIAKTAGVMEDVLIIGETGTGKELVSRAIHMQSARRNGPFITINCGALDENLLMDTLFGHVKGAYTEAGTARKGAFLTAEGGTLMLDELGTASTRVQQALLRALSDRAIHPLGSDEFIRFDTRVIAATNADLKDAVQKGTFREDLYFRLAVITIATPPLRQHKSDIPLMISAFLKEGIARPGSKHERIPDISRGALSQIMHHHWPGNVRELRNCIFRTLAFCDGDIILPGHLQIRHAPESPEIASIQEAQGMLPEEKPRQASSQSERDASASRQKAKESSRTEDAQAVRSDVFSSQEGAAVTQEEKKPVRRKEKGAATQGLSQRILNTLPRILEMESITRQQYQDMTGVSARTAQYDLQELVNAGTLTKMGKGPAMRYIVAASK